MRTPVEEGWQCCSYGCRAKKRFGQRTQGETTKYEKRAATRIALTCSIRPLILVRVRTFCGKVAFILRALSTSGHEAAAQVAGRDFQEFYSKQNGAPGGLRTRAIRPACRNNLAHKVHAGEPPASTGEP